MTARASVAALLLSLFVAGPAYADRRGDAKEQVEFGIQVAQRGLWREAIYRWERATQIDPSYAAAYNNLAVAYEHEGQLDKRRVREGHRARAVEYAHQAELRSLQGDQ
jgi:Tfp pilus assembly protein PilF